MATSGLLLISGIVNVARIMATYGNNFAGPYHALLGVKILLALGVFWIQPYCRDEAQRLRGFVKKNRNG